MSAQARFTRSDHCTSPGWEVYWERRHLRGSRWTRFRCWILVHVLPPAPETPNGYSPNNYAHCRRCNNPMKWYVVGQHRYGSLDRA